MTSDLKSRTAMAARNLEGRFGVPRRRAERDLVGLFIRTILSQNTNDVNSSRAYRALRVRFKSWERVLRVPRRRVSSAIRVAGLSKQKTGTILDFLTWLKSANERLDLSFIRKMANDEIYELLCRIKGVGVKTVSILLAFGLGRDVFPVDTHVNRVCIRLGLAPEKSAPERTHRLMAGLVPKGKAYSFHLNLIGLGRTICRAREPWCNICPLNDICPYGLAVLAGGRA